MTNGVDYTTLVHSEVFVRPNTVLGGDISLIDTASIHLYRSYIQRLLGNSSYCEALVHQIDRYYVLNSVLCRREQNLPIQPRCK